MQIVIFIAKYSYCIYYILLDLSKGIQLEDFIMSKTEEHHRTLDTFLFINKVYTARTLKLRPVKLLFVIFGLLRVPSSADSLDLVSVAI